MATGVRIEGLEELQKILKDRLPNEAHNLARAATHALAKEVAGQVKTAARRKTGRMARSIKAKRGRGDRTTIYSDVIFETGKAAKNDGFYWRFIEHGVAPHSVSAGADRSVGRGAGLRLNRTTRALERQAGLKLRMHPGTPKRPFVRPTVERMRPQLPARYRELVGKKLEQKLARERRKAQRGG